MLGELVDVQAERAVLTLIAEESRVMGAATARRTLEAAAFLPEDFADQMHRAFFVTLTEASHGGRTLIPSMLPDGRFRELLEPSDLMSPAQLATLSERLRDLSARRQLWEAAKRIANATRDEAVSVPQLVARFADEARNVSARQSHWKSHLDALDRAGERIRAVQDGRATGAIRSGFHALDEVTGGFPPTLCVICGLPGMAKSALVGSVLRNLARRGEASAVFSLEDRIEWLAFRWLSHESDVSQFALRNCKLNEQDWKSVGVADAQVRRYPALVHIDDRSGLRPAEILLAARAAYRDLGAKLLIVDNMTAVRFTRGARMDLEIQDFLVEARSLADEFQAPFIVVAHAKRRDGLRPGDLPLLTDCRESAAFENCSRMALGIARDPERPEIDVGVLKNTFGKSGVRFALPFRPKSALLEEGA